MNNLIVKERRKDAVVILDLKGQIRLGDGSAVLHTALAELQKRGERNVLLNLERVTHMDSSGLGEIIAAHVRFKKTNGSLKLLHLTKRVRELIVITKLLTVLDCFKSEADAVKSFRPFFYAEESLVSQAMPGYSGL